MVTKEESGGGGGIEFWDEQTYAAAAKLLQSCLTLCDPIEGSPPGSPVLGILQARTLEWAAISFSKAWKWKEKVKSLSRVRLFATPWTAAHQASPSMGFSRQEYWSGLPLPSLILGASHCQRCDLQIFPLCGSSYSLQIAPMDKKLLILMKSNLLWLSGIDNGFMSNLRTLCLDPNPKIFYFF